MACTVALLYLVAREAKGAERHEDRHCCSGGTFKTRQKPQMGKASLRRKMQSAVPWWRLRLPQCVSALPSFLLPGCLSPLGALLPVLSLRASFSASFSVSSPISVAVSVLWSFVSLSMIWFEFFVHLGICVKHILKMFFLFNAVGRKPQRSLETDKQLRLMASDSVSYLILESVNRPFYR